MTNDNPIVSDSFLSAQWWGKKKERKHSLLNKCGKKGKGDRIIKRDVTTVIS